jgi:transcription elongation factor GreA
MDKVYLTVGGAKALREELKHLKTVVRPKIVHDIAVARAHGDLKENAEYHAAREQQSFCEGRVKEIEGKLSNAEVIDVSKVEAHGKVIFGATVDLMDEETEDEITYQLVGEDEADIKINKISITSPVARALIGKQEGDVAEVQAPGGVKSYEIVEVRYEV